MAPASASAPTSTPSGAQPISVPDDLKQFQTPGQVPGSRPAQSPGANTTISTPLQSPPVNNMFSMFNADETNLNISVKVKLPNKKLLKLMYENADNKDKFLKDLSEHVYSKINKSIIGESLRTNLVPASKKAPIIEKKTEVTATEVTDE
jgi:hypothetical protein